MKLESMLIERPFKIGGLNFNAGELRMSSPDLRKQILESFELTAKTTGTINKIDEYVKFIVFDSMFDKATKDGNFTDMIIVRYGGIGDLIALTSIIDYFDDKRIHFITNMKYSAVFDWFVIKPYKVYGAFEPFQRKLTINGFDKRFRNWAKFQGEGIIENGSSKNWFELFFEFIEENEPDKEFLRPDLKQYRINDKESNISYLQKQYSLNSKSLLICNKSTIMMRTCKASDIIAALPENNYDIFVYESSLMSGEKIPKEINIIPKTDLETFLLDCFDADMVISVDSGALHFREGIGKPAIGLYNSFTTESRTKYYIHTKSYDIESDCDLQPCFLHERADLKFCPKGNKDSFAAPCLDSEYNNTLHEQLKEIFKTL
jgi:hypothetical protein